jgi:hypothetical protein
MATTRERLLAIMAGRSPDRIPWVPRLKLWYDAHERQGTLPDRYRGLSRREIEADLQLGAPARDGRIFRSELRDVETRVHTEAGCLVTEYVTPRGTVSTTHRRSDTLDAAGIQGREMGFLIQGPDDYGPVEFLIERTEIIPTYDDYEAYEAEIGDDGVPLVSIGQDPMSEFLLELAGYNTAYYHLHDYPELVHHLLGVLNERAQVVQQVALDSPARLIMQGEHFHTQFTPARLFGKYMVPYYQPFAERMRERGKTLVCHADADTTHILALIKEAGFAMAECFVTAPMVSMTLARARQILGDDVIIWGGIPSVMLCDPVTDAQFEAYMLDLFRTIAPGDAFILGVADNVMPEAKIERIGRVSEMVEAYGSCPIDPATIA